MIKNYFTYINEAKKSSSFIINDVYEKNNKNVKETLNSLRAILLGKYIRIYELHEGKYVNVNKLHDDINIKWDENDPVRDISSWVNRNKIPSFELNHGFGVFLTDKIVYKIPKVIISKNDPYGEEDWEDEVNESWNPFKKKLKLKDNPHAQFDPYGEEVWEDDQIMPLLRNKFFMWKDEDRSRYPKQWNRVLFKNGENKYIIVGHFTPTFCFTFGFEAGQFDKVKLNTDQTAPLNDEQYGSLMIELNKPNLYMKVKSHKIITNLEILISYFNI